LFRHSRFVGAGVPAVVCLSFVLATSCSEKKAGNPAAFMMMQAVPVRAIAAEAADVPLQVAAVGNAEAMASVDVKSRVAGQILRVDFTEGQDVKQGQLLFEIDPEPLQRQLAELEATLAKDVALEAQARANIVKDEAQLKQAKGVADRGLALSKDGIFSKEQTEQVVATADSAQAALTADQAAAESASAATKADRARIDQTKLQLTYTKITSPISGRAGAVALKQGNLVKDNDTALVTVLQVSPIYVSFGVPEQLLADVRRFQSVRPLAVQARVPDADPVMGKLGFIDNTVDATTGTVKMKAIFDNPKRTLWPGQFVNVQAELNLEHGRILIPSRAIQTGPQGKYVWLMNKDASVAMRPVNVLRLYHSQDGTEQAVIGSGLQGGDMVISEGQMRLMPGAKVRLLKPETQQISNGDNSPSDNKS
jgi:membrane fusion protein, multidrug efflux system